MGPFANRPFSTIVAGSLTALLVVPTAVLYGNPSSDTVAAEMVRECQPLAKGRCRHMRSLL